MPGTPSRSTVLVAVLLVGGAVSTVVGVHQLSSPPQTSPTETPTPTAPAGRDQRVTVSLSGPTQVVAGKTVVFAARVMWEHQRPDTIRIDFGDPVASPSVCVSTAPRPAADAPGGVVLRAEHTYTGRGVVDVRAVASTSGCQYYQGSAVDQQSVQVFPSGP